jgi:hypothetical protein
MDYSKDQLKSGIEMFRLGKSGQGKPRPIKIVFANPSDRKTWLEKKANMQEKPALSEVSVRKVTLPLVREEWKRLNDAKKEAADHPDNAMRSVQLKDGILGIDGVEIDRYRKPGWADNFRGQR